VSRRDAVSRPTALVLIAGLAWWLSVDRMQGMSAGPTARLGGFGWFTATWLAMMAAMMLPAAVPMLSPAAIARPGRAIRWRRILGPVATVVAYLAVWTAAGVVVYLTLQAGRPLVGGAFEWHRAGRWLCAAVIAVAAGYQLTRAKRRWLARCHAPSINAGGTIPDGFRAGGHAGLRCLANSWALMAALFALGAMNLVWMAVVAILITVERLAPIRWWRRRPFLRTISAALLVTLAVALATSPGSIPGFTVPGGAPSHSMSRMNGM
jgi:predicted metal-binding membrane protein